MTAAGGRRQCGSGLVQCKGFTNGRDAGASHSERFIAKYASPSYMSGKGVTLGHALY